MVYLDTPYALVEWDSANRHVHIAWRDFAYGEEYRLVHETILKVVAERGSGKVLADARRMKAAPQEDQEWLMKDWIPRAGAGGLKHMAIVLPKTTLGQMTLQRLVEGTTGSKRLVSGDGTSYFESVEDARKWLKSIP
ncbi:MAG: STAS/SEC14 domain-containing protein [Polyangiaceae bacterium]|nr:hypothetical protein [Polyangiaceae bacterium]NUQ73760.1 STAS/SEC14 domain-containing protein [Polyangiaceae bacterium]